MSSSKFACKTASAVALLVSVVCSQAQHAGKADPAINAYPAVPHPAGPSVKFSQNFPGSNPESYAVEVFSDAHVGYISSDSSNPEPFQFGFEIAPSARDRIFGLAKEAGYFSGKLDSGRKLAFTGEKRLEYHDAETVHSGVYNYSDLKPVQSLTSYFSGISLTMECVRRLTFSLLYQKLALDDELKQMERQAQDHQLEELQAAGAVLRKIASDATVIKGVRARAQRLADLSGSN